MCLLLKPSILSSHPFRSISVSLDFPSLPIQLYPSLSLSEATPFRNRSNDFSREREPSPFSEIEASPLEGTRLHAANGCPLLIHAITELGNVNKSAAPSDPRSHSYSGENKEESLTRCLAVPPPHPCTVTSVAVTHTYTCALMPLLKGTHKSATAL